MRVKPEIKRHILLLSMYLGRCLRAYNWTRQTAHCVKQLNAVDTVSPTYRNNTFSSSWRDCHSQWTIRQHSRATMAGGSAPPLVANVCEGPTDSERSLQMTRPSSEQCMTIVAHDDAASYNISAFTNSQQQQQLHHNRHLLPSPSSTTVSYTHLTLPTNREV